MTLKTNMRFMVSGVLLAYLPGMGALVASSFGSYGVNAMKLVLLPCFVIGAVLVAIARFSHLAKY
jgi:hypothetical protein